VNGLLLTIRIILVRVGFIIGRLLPLRPRVVLATAHATRIGGNLACIRAELAREHPGTEVVVHAHRPEDGLRGRAVAARHALVAGWHLARARVVVVDDYYFPLYVIDPRPGTTVIQVWHACGAFKKFGYSVLVKSFGADEAFARRVRLHANYHVCLVSSRSAAPHYAEAFRQPLERFVSHLGIPRTDVFFDDARIAGAQAEVRRRYAIPADRRVILYAPTYRGDSVTAARFDAGLDLALLHATLGDDHLVLVRLHPFIRSAAPIPSELAGFAVDVSDHPDIDELMLVSDVLVTDYSSAIYEFSLLGKPICFFAPDLDAYERERGFYFDYRTGVPGPVFETTDALARHLRAGEHDLDRVARFRDASFDVADGGATRRVVDELILPALR
jgi:CDP-glycerol glycerophosphotransferase (TagB/SpsB family)